MADGSRSPARRTVRRPVRRFAAAVSLCSALAGPALPVDARAAETAAVRADDGCADLRAALRAGDQRVGARAEVRENGALTREIELSAGGLRRVFHAPVSGIEAAGGSLSQQFYAEAGLLPDPRARCVAVSADAARPAAASSRRLQVIGGRESTITIEAATGLPIRVEQRTDAGAPRVVVLQWGARGAERASSTPAASPLPVPLPPSRGPRVRT